MSAIKMLSAVILSLVVSKAVASGPVFKSNAVDHISIEHKTSIRRSEKVYDFTKLEIEAKLLDMLEDQDVINKDKMMVEYKSVVSEWQELESQPSLRGGVYKWTIPDVVPCHNHNVRLTVFGKDGSRNTWSYPHTIVAPAQDMIIKSGYTPETPETINIGNYQNGQMDLSWTPSHCAGSYDVIYSPMIGGGETASIQAFDNSLTLENLESCQEYEITVYAVLGEQYSQEAVETFMTYPDDNVAEKLDPEIVPDTDNVLVKWKGSEKLSCIPKYNVQLCQDGGECHGNVDMDRDDSVQYMEFQSNQLDMCTKYSLSIRPVHEKKYVQPKIVNFRTLSQPLEDMEELLAPVSAKIDQDMTISVSWSPVPCAEYYNVYQRHEDSDMWENIGTTEQTSFQKIGQSCSKFIYGVAVVVDGVESQKVEYDEAIVTDAKHDELPIMVVEEKANGSMTFTLKSSLVNTMCEVDQLHIKHAGGEDYYNMEDIVDSRITISVIEGSDKVEGRVHYTFTDSWSPFVSSDSPIMEKQTLREMNFLLPIIIGSVVALVLIITVIFLVVKSKKDKTKYDEEKAHGNTDESKKLNDSEEKIINGKK